MAAAMAQSLARAPAIMDRTPSSPEWFVSIQRVTNLTTDVIPARELWAVMALLRSSLPIRAFMQQRNIAFVLPAQRVRELRADPNLGAAVGDFDARFGSDRKVTHVMTAVFRSVTRATADARTDLYECDFEIVDLRTGRPVWADHFTFKRFASGAIWD